MSNRVIFTRAAARAVLPVPVAAAALLIASIGIARADSPEYWNKETFRTERPIVTASLASDDDDDAPRTVRHRQPERRASITRGENERPLHRPAKSRKAEKKAAKTKRVRVASLGKSFAPAAPEQKSVGGGGGSIRWIASASCLNGGLRSILAEVAARFGPVTVNSTCRSRSRNARVGGARRSMHLTGNAADFRVKGSRGAVAAYVRSRVGGFKHYGGGLFHIDTGPRRTW